MKLGLNRGTVILEEHNDEWEIVANKTIILLKKILNNSLVNIEHVGSTAIKSICAKPIIDLVIGVNDFNDIFKYNEILEQKGFSFRGQDHPEQYLYVCGHGNFITHHIHVVLYDSIYWHNYLNMRDYLNDNLEDAKRYDALKRMLAKEYGDNRKKYTEMKSALINELLEKASIWRKNYRH